MIAGCLKSGFQRSLMPAECIAGSSAIAMIAMPAVAPMAECPLQAAVGEDVADDRGWSTTWGTIAKLAMMTTLDSTGAQAAAKNRRSALSRAVASAVKP